MPAHGRGEDPATVFDPFLGCGGDGIAVLVEFGGERAVGRKIGKAEG